MNEIKFYIGALRVKLILECQTGAELYLALNEPKQVALRSHSTPDPEHAPQEEKTLLILYANQPMENQKDPTPDEKSHRVIGLLSSV